MATTMPVSLVRSTQSVHKLLAQPDGRDKVVRLIQYVCKMLYRSDTAGAVERTLSSSRQVGRLFKWVTMYMTIRQTHSSMPTSTTSPLPSLSLPLSLSPAEYACRLVHDLAMFSYYLTDNFALKAKLGVVPADSKRLAKHSIRLWFVSLIAGLSLSVLRIRATQKRIASLSRTITSTAKTRPHPLTSNGSMTSKTNGGRCGNAMTPSEHEHEDEAVEELKQLKTIRNIRALTAFKQVCDLSVATNGSFDIGLHQAFVGLCGTVSSIVGLYQSWPSSL